MNCLFCLQRNVYGEFSKCSFVSFVLGKIKNSFNVDHISMIEIEYAVPGSEGDYWRTSLDHGLTCAEAVRFYRVHVAGVELLLAANPNDPVMKVFEDIYKNSIKG